MLLSLGGLCFRNLHLEYNTQAVDLHRDLTFRWEKGGWGRRALHSSWGGGRSYLNSDHFCLYLFIFYVIFHPTSRRLQYGVDVNLNLSVEVQDHDYKPIIWITLQQQQHEAFLPPNSNNNISSNNNNVAAAVAADKQHQAAAGAAVRPDIVDTANNKNINGAGVVVEDFGIGKAYINANYIKMLGDGGGGGGDGGGGAVYKKNFYACDAGCLDPPVELGWVILLTLRPRMLVTYIN